MAQYRCDLKLVKSHMGYDPTKWDFAEKLSEFDCDSPIIECSTENILREVREKGEKHKSGNTDLFIFVLEDEFEAMMDLLQRRIGLTLDECITIGRDNPLALIQ